MPLKAIFALSVALALAAGAGANAKPPAPAQNSTEAGSPASPSATEVSARFNLLKSYIVDLGAARHIDWESLSKLKDAGAEAPSPAFLQAQREALKARATTLSAFWDVLSTASLDPKLHQIIADWQNSTKNDQMGTQALLDDLGADNTTPSPQNLDNLSQLAGAMKQNNTMEVAQGFFLLTILSLHPKEPGSEEKAKLIFTRAQCNELIAIAKATGPDGDGLGQYFSAQNVKAADE